MEALFHELESEDVEYEHVLIMGQEALALAKDRAGELTVASAATEAILEAETMVLCLQSIVDFCALQLLLS